MINGKSLLRVFHVKNLWMDWCLGGSEVVIGGIHLRQGVHDLPRLF
jgi:hypothetical protein